MKRDFISSLLKILEGVRFIPHSMTKALAPAVIAAAADVPVIVV